MPVPSDVASVKSDDPFDIGEEDDGPGLKMPTPEEIERERKIKEALEYVRKMSGQKARVRGSASL